VAFWRGWLRHSRYSGRWREMVHRSALTLKLLTYAPTGAIVAAPTTSLPEQLGGTRNWDYRYTWMRDAAFTLYALPRLGFTDEAAAFMSWLEERIPQAANRESGPLQIMYGIDGREDLPEEQLSHLEGYMGSVRIGNGAATQLQLDVYGELMDSVYLCNKHGLPIYHDGWMEITRSLEWLINHWDQPDEGI
jgi:GH15 family glucan-1,4-alpha-glucosidase